MNLLEEGEISNVLLFSVSKKWVRFFLSIVTKSLTTANFLIGVTLILFSFTSEIFAQDCPSFQEVEIKNTQVDNPGGQAIFKIVGRKQYDEQNFQVRQKQKQVTGPLDFDVKIVVVGNELRISGLKRSDELYLDEYVIFFSDRLCENGRVVEVGTFKIN